MIFILATIFGLQMANAQTETVNYVVTPTDTIFCGKMHVGAMNLKFEQANGEKHKISLDEVVRYSNNGSIHQRKPVYKNGEKSGKSRLMKLVRCHNHVRVYKDEYYNGVKECLDAKFYFYEKGTCVNIMRNPGADQIMAFTQNRGEANNPGSSQEKQLANQ